MCVSASFNLHGNSIYIYVRKSLRPRRTSPGICVRVVERRRNAKKIYKWPRKKSKGVYKHLPVSFFNLRKLPQNKQESRAFFALFCPFLGPITQYLVHLTGTSFAFPPFFRIRQLPA